MKKSGLADSPFFSTPPSTAQPEIAHEEAVHPKAQAAFTIFETQEAEHANARTGEHTDTRSHEQLNTRTPERLHLPPAPEQSHRKIIRHSFNFYADQIQALKRLRLMKELDGKPLNLSDLVREAIDNFLKEQSR